MVFLFFLRLNNGESHTSTQLSGIGDRYELSRNGIEPIVHLPGVGTNLQGSQDTLCSVFHLHNVRRSRRSCQHLVAERESYSFQWLHCPLYPTRRSLPCILDGIWPPKYLLFGCFIHEHLQKLIRHARAGHPGLLDARFFPRVLPWLPG